jgi:hypothetical protein
MPLKMFCVKGFAGGEDAAASFGYAVVATGAINTAAMTAAAAHCANNVMRQTCVTGKLLKADSIKETVKKPIVNATI